MGYTGIIILSAFVLSWIFVQCFKTFEDNESLFSKILGVFSCILMSVILVAFCLNLREEIRYNALEDYFNGKIEVVENQQTVRTYKQIK